MFNLLDKQWIPVLYHNGSCKRVGIRTALLEAGKIRQIAASNPMDRVALLRFLLAVLLWCKPDLGDGDRARLNGAVGVPKEWLTENLGTVDQPNKAFNLLGDGGRFMQAPASADGKRPVADLYHELPGDSNKAHLRHIQDYREGACPACIAIGLVRLPVAITGKGSGKRPGINGDPPMYFVPVGKTLLDTLLINVPEGRVQGDHPCWSTNQIPSQDRVGVMEGFTWTSRQFRISHHGAKRNTCIVCGTVTDDIFVELKELNKPNGREGLSRCDANRWRDPHISYNEDNKPWQSEDAEKNLPETSGQWRDWLSMLFANNFNGLQSPQAIATARCRLEGQVSVLAAGIAMHGQDKAVESCVYSIALRNSDEALPAKLKQLDDTVIKVIDPHVTLKGKKLSQLKDKHPLRVIRHGERPLPDSVRAALADRLPTLELAMYDSVRSDCRIVEGPRGVVAATNWQSMIADVAKATTTVSPLRRNEAVQRAVSALDETLRKLLLNRQSDASPGKTAEAVGNSSAHSTRGKRKKGNGA